VRTFLVGVREEEKHAHSDLLTTDGSCGRSRYLLGRCVGLSSAYPSFDPGRRPGRAGSLGIKLYTESVPLYLRTADKKMRRRRDNRHTWVEMPKNARECREKKGGTMGTRRRGSTIADGNKSVTSTVTQLPSGRAAEKRDAR